MNKKFKSSNQSIEESAIEHVMGHPQFEKELEDLGTYMPPMPYLVKRPKLQPACLALALTFFA